MGEMVERVGPVGSMEHHSGYGVTQDDLDFAEAAYVEFYALPPEFPLEDLDAIAEALGEFQKKHAQFRGMWAHPNRVCALAAVRAMQRIEREFLARD